MSKSSSSITHKSKKSGSGGDRSEERIITYVDDQEEERDEIDRRNDDCDEEDREIQIFVEKLPSSPPSNNNNDNNSSNHSFPIPPPKQEQKQKIEKQSVWSKGFQKLMSVPSTAATFLGVDQNNVTTTNSKSPSSNDNEKSDNSNILAKGSSSSTDDNDNFKNNVRNSPTHRVSNTAKTLNHWNQRTFRVLNDNLVFGGKLKETKVREYIDHLDDNEENDEDITDPFLFYKRSGGEALKSVHTLNRRKSVAGLAVNGIRTALTPSSNNNVQQQQRQERQLTKKSNHPRVYQYQKNDDEDVVDIPPTRLDEAVAPNMRLMSKQEEQQLKRNKREQPVGTRFFDDIENEDQLRGVDVYEKDENLDGPCDAFTHAFRSGSKRLFGVGFCGRLFDNFLDPAKKTEYEHLIKSIKQQRPYFTYWVTFVQCMVCLVSLFAYGVAPIGFSSHIQRRLATTINLEKQLISYPVKENFWVGPQAMDLVHLGAKYAPCMRNDSNIYEAVELDKRREKESACCVRNDRGGCVQTSRQECSQLLSVFEKWDGTKSINNPSNRTSGSVCGLDPNFCADKNANKWDDDITSWPVCEKPTGILDSTIEQNPHMHCEIIGRPCCVGIQGECMITTLEHCQSMRGYFHGKRNLCSQVDCMQDVCGMIDFLNEKSPDQVYRLFTSIFIHAGIVQLLITILFQLFILRDVEKLAGCLRVAIIYSASGVIGNLGSAIFLPYQAEVGPLGSQFGIVACLFVEVFHAWDLYLRPWLVLLKLVLTLAVLLLIGLLPMIDNFANVFGFLSGLLLASILFPNINLKGSCRRVLIISVAVSITVVLVAALVVMFYVNPVEDCTWCKYLSCPFGSKYCLDMDFNITRLAKS